MPTHDLAEEMVCAATAALLAETSLDISEEQAEDITRRMLDAAFDVRTVSDLHRRQEAAAEAA
jgi:hypothetical protein